MKRTIQIALKAPIGTGKSAVAALIAQTLRNAGFAVSLDEDDSRAIASDQVEILARGVAQKGVAIVIIEH